MKSIEDYKNEMMSIYRTSGQSEKKDVTPILSEKEPVSVLAAQNSVSDSMADKTGGLVVWVTTLRNLYAVPNASVTILDSETDTVIDTATTDLSGRTKIFVLPTPPKNFSDDPTVSNLPYAFYKVNVKADGYVEQTLERVSVFPTITSIQPVDMILNSASNNSGEVR